METADAEVAARFRRVIGRLSRRLNASAIEEGLTPSQASALATIAWRGPLSLADLTKVEGLNPTMVSRIVGRLDQLALIRRIPNPDDMRAAVVEITEEGNAMHLRIREERARVFTRYLERLSEGERRAIVEALPALDALADRLDEGQPPIRQ